MYTKMIKRIADFFISLLGLLILSPLIMLITLVLLICNHGSPFFFQKRPGQNGKIFTIIKFKTMNDKTNDFGELLPDMERITSIGNWIRNHSLDEIPQLFNVLKGDMSLVGPRPLLVEYLPLYTKEQAKRHDVKPGITGWAQIHGRNAISWEDKFRFDLWYVDHISFITDIQILWKTVMKVLAKEGISSDEDHTMPKFTGT